MFKFLHSFVLSFYSTVYMFVCLFVCLFLFFGRGDGNLKLGHINLVAVSVGF